jgi:uncharacterized membrane protein
MDRFRWLLWIIGVVLIGNFAALMIYGDTLRSTHLFVVRGTVFYPVAYLNLILGVVLIAILVWSTIARKR